MTNDNANGNSINFCTAIGNVAKEMIAAGVPAYQLAAGLRIEAGKIEATQPRGGDTAGEQEIAAFHRRVHEFINTMQVAGMDEIEVVATIQNVCIERIARHRGASGAAHYLRSMAAIVEANAEAIEFTAKEH